MEVWTEEMKLAVKTALFQKSAVYDHDLSVVWLAAASLFILLHTLPQSVRSVPAPEFFLPIGIGLPHCLLQAEADNAAD